MKLEDAWSVFNDLIATRGRIECAEIAVRSRAAPGADDDYVVEVRWDPGRLSKLGELIEAAQRRRTDNYLAYDGEVELRKEGEEATLWLVISERFENGATDVGV